MHKDSSSIQPRSALDHLRPYVGPVKSEEMVQEIFLASNENSYSNQFVTESLQKFIEQGLHRYPLIDGINLRTELAQHFELEVGNIVLGNGSSEILSLVARAFLDESASAVFSQYCFAVYPLVVKASGAESIEVPSHYGHDLSAMLSAVKSNTKVIFIADPNNPTGTSLTIQALRDFMAQMPKSIVVVWDRAYREYLLDCDEQQDLELFHQYPNLIITRTFSKIYALASMRIGFCFASNLIADYLNRVRMPFNANALALHAATIALKDRAFVKEIARKNHRNAAVLEKFLKHLSQVGKIHEYIPSKANFMSFATAMHSDELVLKLKGEGIVIRGLASYNMPNWARVTVGTPEENSQFMQALERVLEANGQ